MICGYREISLEALSLICRKVLQFDDFCKGEDLTIKKALMNQGF